MKVSRSKTEYMCVNEREGSGTVRLQGEEVKKVQEFKYLGSTVQSNGECGKESFSMASPNSSQTRVFASETTRAAVHLACQYASAASGVPPSQPGSIGLLLQFDGIPYFQCPPLCSGIETATGTRDLTATALDGCINNGGGEHGPLRLNVPKLPQDLIETLPEVGVEDPPDRGISKMFPTDPHNTFGSAKSVRHPPP
ncbi:hypothetical protein QTP70_013505 [Hemibagrus guttatus]|uniref:Uncharacterized protein n=1 Tax=Hemibagrus guttatus TaxID=175788 RepID=A0AAE0QIG3_9TELE|nr:hypothetical protein QTP70_013505 [Hemibagrus guttatus]